MILKDSDITARLESPLNLINRLNRVGIKDNAMDIFVPSQVSTDEAIEPDPVAEIVDEKKLRLGLIKSSAMDVLQDSLRNLKTRLPEVTKVRDLSSIARDMKIILTEDEDLKKVPNQIVIYKPVINDISRYE